jgi:ribose transport system substrate-binding protein
VPKDLVVPLVEVTQDNLEDQLAATGAGSVTNVEYTLEDAQATIAAAK